MTDAATIAIVIGVGVVAMIVVVRWIRWPMLRIAMLAAIPLISVRGWSWTSADSLDHSDTAVQQVYLVDATLAAFGVAMLPARLVGRRPFLLTRWLTVGGVVLACAIFVHVLLSIDIALWRMWGICVFPADPLQGPPLTCSFDKRRKAFVLLALLLASTYAVAALHLAMMRLMHRAPGSHDRDLDRRSSPLR